MKILVDQQEQHPWTFDDFQKVKLPTGDYTLVGYEKVVIVERKGTSGEFAHNLTEARFERELARLEKFPFPFIVCEFGMEEILNYPHGSGIPPEKWPDLKVSAKFFLKRFCEIQTKYRTKVVLAGTGGRDFTLSLFKRVSECQPSSKSTTTG